MCSLTRNTIFLLNAALEYMPQSKALLTKTAPSTTCCSDQQSTLACVANRLMSMLLVAMGDQNRKHANRSTQWDVKLSAALKSKTTLSRNGNVFWMYHLLCGRTVLNRLTTNANLEEAPPLNKQRSRQHQLNEHAHHGIHQIQNTDSQNHLLSLHTTQQPVRPTVPNSKFLIPCWCSWVPDLSLFRSGKWKTILRTHLGYKVLLKWHILVIERRRHFVWVWRQ